LNILINKNFSFLSSPLAVLYSGISILKNIANGATGKGATALPCPHKSKFNIQK